MPGTVVNATNLDSVRIEVLGESRAVTIRATVLLAVHRLLKRAFIQETTLTITTTTGRWKAILGNRDPTGKTDLGELCGIGETPWEALIALEEALS